MTAAQARIKGIVQRLGESYTTAGSTRRGIFGLLSPGQARAFLSDADIASASLPIRRVYVPFDDPTASGATVSFGGLTLTVSMAMDLHHLGATVARLLVLT